MKKLTLPKPTVKRPTVGKLPRPGYSSMGNMGRPANAGGLQSLGSMC